MNLLLHPRTAQQVTNFLSGPVHAVALAGAPGAGKDYLSLYIISQMLGITIERAERSVHVMIIDAEADDGIEKVREMRAFLNLKVPGNGNIRRCVLIRNPDKLRLEAQNALLKTLEEPPTDTVLICTISNKQRVIPTVSSRLQWIDVLPISYEIAETELSVFSGPQLKRAYYISDGNVGLMMALLEENDEHPMFKVITQAKSVLQAASYERLISIEIIVKDKHQDIPGLLDALYKLLHAAMTVAIKQSTKKHSDIIKLNQQIGHIIKAQKLLENRAQPKLVLTWLFYSL